VNPLGLSSVGNDPSTWGTGVKMAIHKPIVKYGRFGLPDGFLPGGGRPGLKYGISRKIREIWQPYALLLHLHTVNLHTFSMPPQKYPFLCGI